MPNFVNERLTPAPCRKESNKSAALHPSGNWHTASMPTAIHRPGQSDESGEEERRFRSDPEEVTEDGSITLGQCEDKCCLDSTAPLTEESAELVELEDEATEWLEEAAEELATFEEATQDFSLLIDSLNKPTSDDGPLEHSRSRAAAIAGALRRIKACIKQFTEPLALFGQAQLEPLRAGVRMLSHAVVHLLNGIQAGAHSFVLSKLTEVRICLASLKPLLLDFLFEACARADAHQDLLRQAALLREAADVGTVTVKMLKKAWQEMVDMSVLASNIKQMIRLSVLASDKGNGMSTGTAKRIKRQCLRLGKACECLLRGVRLGQQVDDQFGKLVSALAQWRSALVRAQQDICLTR